jgi:hypothetical protein
LDQTPELLINPRDMPNYFNQPYNREAFPLDDRFHARLAQPDPGTPKESELRLPTPEFLDQQRRIAIPRRLARRDEDGFRQISEYRATTAGSLRIVESAW